MTKPIKVLVYDAEADTSCTSLAEPIAVIIPPPEVKEKKSAAARALGKLRWKKTGDDPVAHGKKYGPMGGRPRKTERCPCGKFAAGSMVKNGHGPGRCDAEGEAKKKEIWEKRVKKLKLAQLGEADRSL